MKLPVYCAQIKQILNIGCHAHLLRKWKIYFFDVICKRRIKDTAFGLWYILSWLKSLTLLKISLQTSNKYIVSIGNCESNKKYNLFWECLFMFYRHFFVLSTLMLKLFLSESNHYTYCLQILHYYLSLVFQYCSQALQIISRPSSQFDNVPLSKYKTTIIFH